jgi:hypothetical protein
LEKDYLHKGGNAGDCSKCPVDVDVRGLSEQMDPRVGGKNNDIIIVSTSMLTLHFLHLVNISGIPVKK